MKKAQHHRAPDVVDRREHILVLWIRCRYAVPIGAPISHFDGKRNDIEVPAGFREIVALAQPVHDGKRAHLLHFTHQMPDLHNWNGHVLDICHADPVHRTDSTEKVVGGIDAEELLEARVAHLEKFVEMPCLGYTFLQVLRTIANLPNFSRLNKSFELKANAAPIASIDDRAVDIRALKLSADDLKPCAGEKLSDLANERFLFRIDQA